VGGVDFSSPTLDATRERLLVRFGTRAEAWWDRLPAVVADLAERWHLRVDDAVGRGNTSVVLRCRCRDGRAAVLKLTPDGEIASAEAAALRRWQDSGRVPLVWGHDAAEGALLLEAMPNEVPLAELRTGVEVNEIAQLIGALHRAGAAVVGDGVETLAARVEFMFALVIERHAGRGAPATSVVSVDRLRRGRDLARRLSAGAAVAVLLHGDLHPGNVLDGGPGRGLVAIDPRPCVGDAACDVVDWVFWGVEDPAAWEARSRDLALALGLAPARVWSWCGAFAAMLAAARAARGAGAGEVAALMALAP
jgi:streptomycin 6-kinase